jgi:hypothetical protein
VYRAPMPIWRPSWTPAKEYVISAAKRVAASTRRLERLIETLRTPWLHRRNPVASRAWPAIGLPFPTITN